MWLSGRMPDSNSYDGYHGMIRYNIWLMRFMMFYIHCFTYCDMMRYVYEMTLWTHHILDSSTSQATFPSPNFVRYFKPALCCSQLGRTPWEQLWAFWGSRPCNMSKLSVSPSVWNSKVCVMICPSQRPSTPDLRFASMAYSRPAHFSHWMHHMKCQGQTCFHASSIYQSCSIIVPDLQESRQSKGWRLLLVWIVNCCKTVNGRSEDVPLPQPKPFLRVFSQPKEPS